LKWNDLRAKYCGVRSWPEFRSGDVGSPGFRSIVCVEDTLRTFPVWAFCILGKGCSSQEGGVFLWRAVEKSQTKMTELSAAECPPFAKNAKDGPPRVISRRKGGPPPDGLHFVRIVFPMWNPVIRWYGNGRSLSTQLRVGWKVFSRNPTCRTPTFPISFIAYFPRNCAGI